ncbi:MAG: DUF192 domain-containing protein [Kiritimatiellae bacterium]|nr:DUF192 domain-containing protein [Kiritimatiellia bacterium]
MEERIVNGIKARVAKSFFARLKGLIGVKDLAEGEGLLIERCSSIHTCFMSMTIDATFLDENERVVRIVKGIKPWRLCVLGGKGAKKVLETKSSL